MEQIQANRVVLALSLTKSPGRAKTQLKKQSISAQVPALVLHQLEILPGQRSGPASLKLDLCWAEEENSKDVHVITALGVTLRERIIFLTSLGTSLCLCSMLASSVFNMLFGVDNQFLTSFQNVHKSNWIVFLDHVPCSTSSWHWPYGSCCLKCFSRNVWNQIYSSSSVQMSSSFRQPLPNFHNIMCQLSFL